jgi:hypothetical protein
MFGDEVSVSVGVEDIEKESHIRPYTNLQSILYHSSRRIDSVEPTSAESISLHRGVILPSYDLRG